MRSAHPAAGGICTDSRREQPEGEVNDPDTAAEREAASDKPSQSRRNVAARADGAQVKNDAAVTFVALGR